MRLRLRLRLRLHLLGLLATPLLLVAPSDSRAAPASVPGPGATQATKTPKIPKRLRTLLGRTYNLRYHRGRGYLATTVGLRIVNLRRPSRPKPLGTLVIPGSVNGLLALGTTAYVAAGPHGVVLADVSNPRKPTRLSRINTPGSANAVALDGKTLYVADGSFGVGIYDVTAPSKPTRLAKVETGCYARDVAVHGRWIIVACGRAGLVVFRSHRSGKRKKAWPKPLHRLKLAGDSRNLSFGPGRTLYVAAGEAGVHVLDARRPSKLKRVSTAKVPDFAHGVSAWGASVAVAGGEGGVHLFNCRRRNRPRLVATYKSRPNRSANKIFLRRGLVLVAYDAAGLHILKAAKGRLTLRAIFPVPPKKKTKKKTKKTK
jgi:hypothetical protein